MFLLWLEGKTFFAECSKLKVFQQTVMLLTIKVELILDSGSGVQCTVFNKYITGANRPLPRRAPGLSHKIFDERCVSGLYYKTITIVITIVSDATIRSVTYDCN
jgi:hypothetical protein